MPDLTISRGPTAKFPKWPGWLRLLAGPAIAAGATAHRPAWLFMWALAGAIFLGCKWLTWWNNAPAFAHRPGRWSLAYLFLWPGMDPKPFIESPVSFPAPTLKEWSFAAAKTVFGAALLWGVARCAPHTQALLAGWIGMFGVIFLLHFGAFHIAALIWQSAGIRVEPLMRNPIAAKSLSDFWSVRWNRGFTDLAHRHLFQAVRPRIGLAAAMLVTFLASAWSMNWLFPFRPVEGMGCRPVISCCKGSAF
jgi:hypothetical protein